MARKALVVGAAGGVGIEVVRQLIAQGHEVVGSVMDAAQRDFVKREAPQVGDLVIADLSRGDGIAANLAPLLKTDDALDHVVVCAAISPYGPLETTPLEALRNTFEINTIANLAVYQAVIPLLRKSQGRMAVISSMAGRVAFPFIGHYAASKFALEALADVMRREAAQWGVDIIVIEPGGIQTPMVLGQQKAVAADKAALSGDARALYGPMYETFERAVVDGYAGASPPSLVAATIVEALTCATPQTRYPVGADSVFLCDASRKMDDRELDNVARLTKD